MRWRLALAIFCAASTLSRADRSDVGVFDDAADVLRSSARCPNGQCQILVGSREGGNLYKVSAKSRRIGSKLGASGYYSYYSRALKGYPHLRSKTVYRKSDRRVAVNPENRKRFIPHIHNVARLYQLDPKLIDAVISVESAYDPKAVSSKGALGLMQLMPGTAKRFEVSDPLDPVDNMHGGARYLRWLMDRFDNDLDLVLAAYNAGEGALQEYGNRIPPYEETRTYVARVRRVYEARQ